MHSSRIPDTVQPLVCAFVLRLAAGRTFKLYLDTGQLVHAAFLDMVRTVYPELSAALHDINGRKPFTVSPVWGEGQILREGDDANIRICVLNPVLARLFTHNFLVNTLKVPLVLAGVPFSIREIWITPTSHARAGVMHITRPSVLATSTMSVRIDFLSPTAFSRNNSAEKTTHYDLSMQPRNLWNFARRQWELAGGESPGQAFDNWVTDHTDVLHADLQRQYVEFNRFGIPGVCGYTIYHLHGCSNDDPNAIWWEHFAKFMQFCSLGAKSTMGMGQCSVTFIQ